jgi:hypothetical protein
MDGNHSRKAAGLGFLPLFSVCVAVLLLVLVCKAGWGQDTGPFFDTPAPVSNLSLGPTGHSTFEPQESDQNCIGGKTDDCQADGDEAADDDDDNSIFARYYVDYDSGFVIRPFDQKQTPFELQVNGRMQFRYSGFKRDEKFFSNRGDASRMGELPVSSRSDWELERARLEFQGFFLDPDLQFFLNIDGDTDDQHRAVFHDFWVNYNFDEAFNVYLGKAFVPGSRDWLNGSTSTHFADRSMSTTFFRPDRSIGVWAIGEVCNGLHYRTMIGNGFNTTDLRRSGGQVDDQPFFAGSMWWEPQGDFGSGYADLKWHNSPVIRIGQSLSYGNLEPRDNQTVRAEQQVIRLSDGSRLVTPGVLAPGVTVVEFDLYLYTVDFAIKCQGWSFNSEYFMRWLQDFETVGGPSPHTQLFTHGFYFDTGYMLIREKLEAIARVSTVDGLFKDSWEYAAGVNWYINGTHKHKLTFDVSVLDGSPAGNSGPNYEIGQDGTMVRLQYQAAF